MTEILRMYRGDDRRFTMTLSLSDVPVDLSLAEDITFTARRQIADADPAIELVLGDGIEFVTDGTDGQIAVSIPSAATLALGSTTTLLWDVQVTASLTSGEPASIRTWPESSGIPALGKLVVTGDVTRAATS